MRQIRNAMGCVFLLAAASSCESAPPPKPPAEIPIQDFKAEGPAPAPAAADDDAGGTSAATTSGTAKSGGDTKEGGGIATKLDAKNSFAGVQLGASFKSFHGLKQSERSGDHVTYRVTRGTPTYAGAALKDVLYTFNKGKLDTIAFQVKSNADCKNVKEALERELGAPQATSAQGAVWKGEKVGLRFIISPTSSCGGTVMSHELADTLGWATLQP
ncbi:MAG TPA: hypothetical protein VNO21_08735 [Polyangiaceae bacterium]|nr:hypothetical protein [Polyangiaceae bacterium]